MTVDEMKADEAKQQKCEEFFAEYDREHRPRSLMEMHQEKIKKEKLAKKGIREEFNQEGMRHGRIDSKKVMRVIGGATAQMDEKFGRGKYTTSFL